MQTANPNPYIPTSSYPSFSGPQLLVKLWHQMSCTSVSSWSWAGFWGWCLLIRCLSSERYWFALNLHCSWFLKWVRIFWYLGQRLILLFLDHGLLNTHSHTLLTSTYSTLSTEHAIDTIFLAALSIISFGSISYARGAWMDNLTGRSEVTISGGWQHIQYPSIVSLLVLLDLLFVKLVFCRFELNLV